METRMVRLAIDFENPGTEWWEAGGSDLWEALSEGFGENAVVVDSSIADSWLLQAATLPGWTGGPEFSPHPICLKELHHDEEV
jgi:hypothetical protein